MSAAYLHGICGVPMYVEGLGTVADRWQKDCFKGY